jgi:hypothetical protein
VRLQGHGSISSIGWTNYGSTGTQFIQLDCSITGIKQTIELASSQLNWLNGSVRFLKHCTQVLGTRERKANLFPLFCA